MTIIRKKPVAVILCCAMIAAVLLPFAPVAKAAAATFYQGSNNVTEINATLGGSSVSIRVASDTSVTNISYSGGTAPAIPTPVLDNTSTYYDYSVVIPGNTSGNLVVTVNNPSGTTSTLKIKPSRASFATANQALDSNGMIKISAADLFGSVVAFGTRPFSVKIESIPSDVSLFNDSGTLLATGSEISASNNISFKPVGTLKQQYSFTYKIYDGSSSIPSDAITCTINVTGTGAGITATAYNRTYDVPAGTWLYVTDPSRGLLYNATISSGGYRAQAVVNTGAAYGSFTLSSDGTFTYMPYANFTGTDSATYYFNVLDSSGNVVARSNIATVTFRVGTSSGGGGYGGTSRYSTRANNQINVPESDGLLSGYGYYNGYYVQVNANSSSYFFVNRNGSFTFTPPSGQSGVFTLYYSIYTSGGGFVTSQSVGVDVIPVANSATYSVTARAPFSISSTDAQSRNIGSNLRANMVTNPSHGTVTLNTDGTFTYTPASGYVGTDSFTYTVTDTVAHLTSAAATVTFNVGSSNAVPTTPPYSPNDDIGIAVTGESDWLSFMLYALGVMSLLIGARAVFIAVKRMKAYNER